MPTCPGCGRDVAYDRLHIHERHCEQLGEDATWRGLEALDRRLTTVEDRLDRRLHRIDVWLQYYRSRSERPDATDSER